MNILLTLHLLHFLLMPCTAHETDLIGKWKYENKIVEIKKHNVYEGILIANAENKHVGQKILQNLTFVKDHFEGQLYLPGKKMYVNCTIRLIDYNTIQITANKGWMSQTQVWHREY